MRSQAIILVLCIASFHSLCDSSSSLGCYHPQRHLILPRHCLAPMANSLSLPTGNKLWAHRAEGNPGTCWEEIQAERCLGISQWLQGKEVVTRSMGSSGRRPRVQVNPLHFPKVPVPDFPATLRSAGHRCQQTLEILHLEPFPTLIQKAPGSECRVKNGFPALPEQTYLRKARGCCKPTISELLWS